MSEISSSQIASIREANHLTFNTPFAPSCVNQRTAKQCYFSNSTYSSGANMQCRINTSASAVWGKTCYLKVNVSTTGGQASLMGGTQGSVGSLFRSVRLSHRSGTVLEFTDNVSELITARLQYEFNPSQLSNMATAIGQGVSLADTVAQDFIFPMSMLLGTFASDSYIPPSFLSGALLELQLHTKTLALQETVDGDQDYTINSISLVLDEAQLYDQVSKSILTEELDVSHKGLKFAFSTWWNTRTSLAVGALSLDVLKSVSEMSKVVVLNRITANLSDEKQDKTDFENTLAKFHSMQARIGSQYYPQHVISSKAEQYAQAQVAFGVMGSPDKSLAITSANFVSATNCGLWAQTLENSVPLELSGTPTNNSRILNVSFTTATSVQTTDIFIKHLCIVNVMNDTVEVKV